MASQQLRVHPGSGRSVPTRLRCAANRGQVIHRQVDQPGVLGVDPRDEDLRDLWRLWSWQNHPDLPSPRTTRRRPSVGPCVRCRDQGHLSPAERVLVNYDTLTHSTMSDSLPMSLRFAGNDHHARLRLRDPHPDRRCRGGRGPAHRDRRGLNLLLSFPDIADHRPRVSSTFLNRSASSDASSETPLNVAENPMTPDGNSQQPSRHARHLRWPFGTEPTGRSTSTRTTARSPTSSSSAYSTLEHSLIIEPSPQRAVPFR